MRIPRVLAITKVDCRLFYTYIFFAVRKKIKDQYEDTACSNIDLVVDGLVDAVTLRHPPPRYLIGPLSNTVTFCAMLPTATQDSLVHKYSQSTCLKKA